MGYSIRQYRTEAHQTLMRVIAQEGTVRVTNVLLLQRAFRPATGGASRRLEELATLLTESGVGSVRVITLDEGNHEYPPNLRVRRVSGNPLGAVGRWKLVLAAALRLVGGKRSPGVLYINAPFVECGPLVRLARVRGVRVVLQLTLMGQDSPLDLAERSRYPLWLTRRLVSSLAHADLVLTMGDGLREAAILCGWAERRLKFLPHPKSEEIYHPPCSELEKAELRDSFGLPRVGFVCGFVGFLAPRKGLEELVESWELFHKANPGATLAICGPIEDPLRDWAEALLARLSPDRARYVGVLPASRVGDFLRSLDVFVLPSRSEGLPSALVEAMMTGLPCVASSLKGSTTELIDDGISGFLVEPGSVEAIAAALGRLVNQPLRQAVGRQAFLRSIPFHRAEASGTLIQALLGTSNGA